MVDPEMVREKSEDRMVEVSLFMGILRVANLSDGT